MKRALVGLLLLVFLRGSAFAWSGAGHMVIAGIAYADLPVATKAMVNATLKAHPEYENWRAKFVAESEGMDMETFVFLRASTWPDEVRRHHSSYDHPQWHYIDYPLRPSAFAMEPAPTPENDIVFGIQQAEKVLNEPSAAADSKAAHLSWLIHLVGDVHQPLHCASYFSAEFPRGDKGGNAFYVKPNTRGIKLHAFWDGLLGTSSKPRTQLNYATQLRRQFPRQQLRELAAKDVKAWSLQGRTLAIDYAYLRGRLRVASDEQLAAPLPNDYSKNAKIVAEKQAALAGYRLADEIGRAFR